MLTRCLTGRGSLNFFLYSYHGDMENLEIKILHFRFDHLDFRLPVYQQVTRLISKWIAWRISLQDKKMFTREDQI